MNLAYAPPFVSIRSSPKVSAWRGIHVGKEVVLTTISHARKTVLFVTHDIDEAIFLGDVIYVMTARPGRIRTTLQVRIPRPRTFDTLKTAEFSDLKNQVVGIIHEESMKAVESELTHV